MKAKLLAVLAFLLVRVLMFTWRIQVSACPIYEKRLKDKEPTVLAHFHGDDIVCLYLVKQYKLSTMTSTSKDGSIIDYVVRCLGGKTSRGSSTRGGANALKGLIRLVQQGHPAIIAIDGPKGPLHKAKPGAFQISRLAKAPIFSVSVVADPVKIFDKAWDKTYLPYPFSKVIIDIKLALDALETNDDPRDESHAVQLEHALFASRENLNVQLVSTK